MSQCTLVENRGGLGGGGVYCLGSTTRPSSPVLENTIISDSPNAEAFLVRDEYCSPVLTCCDLWGNAGGDWTGPIASQNGVNGNFSACPSFWLIGMGDFHICDGSPCAPGNHPDGYVCGLIGAWPVGCSCGPTRRESATWGKVKARYR